MCPDENNSEEYGRRRGFHRREQSIGASSNGVWIEKNKNKFEMYGWRNPVPQVAYSVHSVFRTPTLQDIPEESDENSDDGQKHISSNSLTYSRGNTLDRCQSFPAQIARESEFSPRDSDTRTFVNVANSEVQIKGTNDKASIPMIDQEFTEMLFLQLQIVKKTLLEMKEQKQVIEDALHSGLEQNQELKKEINFLTEKIKDFQKQEEVMIADRRDLTFQVIAARETILEKEKKEELLLEKQTSLPDNKDQQENVKLANENTQLKSKLENAQNTIRKMIEEKRKWEEDEIVFKTREKEFVKENNRIAIELEVYKQKVKKLETIKNLGNDVSSANSSITSTCGQFQEISSPHNQDPIKIKANTSYVEVVSSTPVIPGEKADKILENILLTPKKNSSQSANSSRYPSYDKLLPPFKESQNLQNKSSGIAGLFTLKENKESLIGKSDYKSLVQRIEVLEAKVNPLTNLVNKTIKNQHANEDELEKRFNQSILAVTNQITSLRKMLETVMTQHPELESKKSAPTAISNSPNSIHTTTTPDSISQSHNTSNFKLIHSKNSSKSYIPVYVNRKSC